MSYTTADQIRQTLKTCRHQHDQYIKLRVNLKNNLITLLDGTFPDINTLFKSASRDTDGHEKWVDFAGVDAPPCQSGTFESKNRHISKRGSPRLRKTLFQVMSTINQHAPADDPIFHFLDRKNRRANTTMST